MLNTHILCKKKFNHLKLVQTSNLSVLSNCSSTVARHGRTTFGDLHVTAQSVSLYLENDVVLHAGKNIDCVMFLHVDLNHNNFHIRGALSIIFCLIPGLYEMI